jgi:hypothetical protein
MNHTLFIGIVAASFATALSISGQPAKADEIITSITSPAMLSSRVATTATLSAGPAMLVTNTSGQQLMIPSSMNSNQILYVTTGDTITGFTCCTPDDLITRRDDLLARIFVEKANGKLSDTQAQGLVSEVQDAYSARGTLCSGNESDVPHVKAVKKIYRQFDRVSNDILRDSHQGNRELAGKYTYVDL